MNTTTEFGISRFAYNMDQMEIIYDYLACNHGDISRVFSIVWYERMFDTDEAPMVLDLIAKIQRLSKDHSTFESLYELWR